MAKKKLANQLLINERSFFAVLVCVCTLLINLYYLVMFNTNPAATISLFPLVLWIAYDGLEGDKSTTDGYWFWVSALIITSIIVILYPLF